MDATSAVPRPDAASERAARMMRGLEWLMIPVVLVLGFMLASFAVRNSDFWMHLATGRLIAEGNYEIGKDPFSFATEGRHWVNHAWLYDFLLYKTYLLDAEHSAVVYVKAFLVAILALVMLLACRPGPDQAIVLGTKANPTWWLAPVAVSLALLAMSPRMLLQPMLLSFLFFAVTFWALVQSRYWPAKVLPIALGVLFALWVNCDIWFFMGPALVAVFLIGEVIQRFLNSDEKSDPARLKLLAVTLVVGLVACLINPHHVRAFTVIPAEIDPNVVRSMQNDEAFRYQFVSPLLDWIIYSSKPFLGKSLPGTCYLALLLLGIASFGLNYQNLRAPLLLTWVSCALLSLLLNWRLIPFFAVVAAPIAVLNIHAFFARRPYRRGVTFASDTAAAATAPAATTAEGWWPGATETAVTAAPATAPAAVESPTLPAGRGDVTPESILAFGGVFGRLLTLISGLALLVLAYPGWLHAERAGSISTRRVTWSVEPEPWSVNVAEKLGQWQREGRLPADARGLALHLDIANYVAWYAPNVRSFMDYRFPFLGDLSADYMRIKRGLSEWAAGAESSDDWAEVLRQRKINYLVLIEGGASGGEPVMGRMLAEDQQWALRFQNGVSAVFGWQDPLAPRAEDPLRLDLVEMAFGEKAVRIPPGDSFDVKRTAPPDTQTERTLLERFLSPPPPPAPPESATANLFWAMRDQTFLKALRESDQALSLATSIGQIVLMNDRTGFWACNRPLPIQFTANIIDTMARIHPLPAAVNLLAVREARRGALAHPNEGLPYLILGKVYTDLPAIGSVLRPVQHITVLRQAVDRMTPEQTQGVPGRMVTDALRMLFEYHAARNQLDLALECLERAVAMYDLHPPLMVKEPDQQPVKEQMQRTLDKLRNEVDARNDQYQMARDEARRRNVPVHQQAILATNLGLVRRALAVLEEAGSQQDLPALRQLILVYLALGRIDEAQLALALIPEQVRDGFLREQILVWTASGEYALAGKALEKQIAAFERSDSATARFVGLPHLGIPNLALTAGEAAAVAFQQLHFACADPAAQTVRLGTTMLGLASYLEVAQQLLFIRTQKAELLAMRGMLAMEEGDVRTARTTLKAALDVRARFPGDVNALLYLHVLDRQAEK